MTGTENGALAKEQLNLNVGDLLQLQTVGDDTAVRHGVRVIGYHDPQSILVTTPRVRGNIAIVREGTVYTVRLLVGNRVVAFTTHVRKVNTNPFPYLHLSYPDEMESVVVRQTPRVNIDLIVSAVRLAGGKPDGPAVPAVLQDLSASGARFKARTEVGDIGSQMMMTGRFKIGDRTRDVSLLAIVRNVSVLEPESKEDDRTVQHGIQFSDLSDDANLVLHAFLYENLIRTLAE